MNIMPLQTDIEDFAPATVDLFSYAVLSREDEVAAKEDAAIIKAHMKSAAESIIAVGLALKRQKDRLPHGMFLPWIEAEFGMTRRTATNFVTVAERYSDKWETVSHLPVSALYELAAPSTPQSVREQVEELIVDGQKVTAADVKRLKAEAKAAEELASLKTKMSELQKQSENKDFDNASEIHRLQLQIDALEKGKALAVKDAEEAEKKASSAETELNERISIAVSKAVSEVEAGYRDEVNRLKGEISELRRPKPLQVITGDSAQVVPFARDLTDEEKAAIDAETDEYAGADFNATASDQDKAITFFGCVRSIASMNTKPSAIHNHITKGRSEEQVSEYMAMIDTAFSQLKAVKELHNG